MYTGFIGTHVKFVHGSLGPASARSCPPSFPYRLHVSSTCSSASCLAGLHLSSPHCGSQSPGVECLDGARRLARGHTSARCLASHSSVDSFPPTDNRLHFFGQTSAAGSTSKGTQCRICATWQSAIGRLGLVIIAPTFSLFTFNFMSPEGPNPAVVQHLTRIPHVLKRVFGLRC